MKQAMLRMVTPKFRRFCPAWAVYILDGSCDDKLPGIAFMHGGNVWNIDYACLSIVGEAHGRLDYAGCKSCSIYARRLVKISDSLWAIRLYRFLNHFEAAHATVVPAQ